MALSGIGLIGTSLTNRQRATENIKSPLALIETRRQKRKEEAQKDEQLKIMAEEARTKAKNAETLAATEARTGDESGALTARMNALNSLYAPQSEPGSPEHLREIQRYAYQLSTDANPDIAEHGVKLIDKFGKMQEATQPGGTSLGEQEQTAEILRKQAEAAERGANADMATQGMTQGVKPPTAEDQVWAINAIKSAYPGYSDLIPFNELSETELGKWTQEMAAMLNQERRQNPGMPEQQLVDMVIRGFAASKGFQPKGLPPVQPGGGQQQPEQPGGQPAPAGGQQQPQYQGMQGPKEVRIRL